MHPGATATDVRRNDPGLMANRLATLSQRHRALDAEIRVESARPVPDAVLLQRMKRQRLHLKEQIARLTRHDPGQDRPA